MNNRHFKASQGHRGLKEKAFLNQRIPTVNEGQKEKEGRRKGRKLELIL